MNDDVYLRFTAGPAQPHGEMRKRMNIDAPTMRIEQYASDRGDQAKRQEKKLRHLADEVRPMSAEALREEIKREQQEREGGKFKKRKGKLKLLAAASVPSDKVIQML